MTDYVGLVRFMVERIVGNPTALAVEALPQGRSTLIEISVADDDMGRVIGKGGRTIEAIRAVVRAAGLRRQERVQVEIAESRE